jgi:hypothetical protein
MPNAMKVSNEYNEGGPSGPLKGITATLVQETSSTPGVLTLKLKPITNSSMTAEYRVVALGDVDSNGKYPWSVVYGPSVDAVFVLYRENTDFTLPGNNLDELAMLLNNLPLDPPLDLSKVSKKYKLQMM